MRVIRLLLMTWPVFAGTISAHADEAVRVAVLDKQKSGEKLSAADAEPISLFDGKTLKGWTTQDGKPVTRGWTVEDGALVRENRGGHILYEKEVGDFELTFQWKITKGGNSGVKYRVKKYGKRLLGCEYQLLGETRPSHSKGSCGSLYALYEPSKKKNLNPLGEWNMAKIVAHGGKIEHWLNGERIVEANVNSDEWRTRLSKSKFAPHKDFARDSRGQIMLTDHGSKVWYKDLVLTPLPNPKKGEKDINADRSNRAPIDQPAMAERVVEN